MPRYPLSRILSTLFYLLYLFHPLVAPLSRELQAVTANYGIRLHTYIGTYMVVCTYISQSMYVHNKYVQHPYLHTRAKDRWEMSDEFQFGSK